MSLFCFTHTPSDIQAPHDGLFLLRECKSSLYKKVSTISNYWFIMIHLFCSSCWMGLHGLNDVAGKFVPCLYLSKSCWNFFFTFEFTFEADVRCLNTHSTKIRSRKETLNKNSSSFSLFWPTFLNVTKQPVMS